VALTFTFERQNFRFKKVNLEQRDAILNTVL